jgi:hypothetical protein
MIRDDLKPYAEMCRNSEWSRMQVAVAWAEGRAHAGGNGHLGTNGLSLYSYDHEVGYTEKDGSKVVRDCRYSVTTVKQLLSARVLADRVEPCPGHAAHVLTPRRSVAR